LRCGGVYSVDNGGGLSLVDGFVDEVHCLNGICGESLLSENPPASLVPLGRGHHRLFSSSGQHYSGFIQRECSEDGATGGS
jgi:hypothetical protein